MTRDELARHLYVNGFDHAGATLQDREKWAAEWDARVVAVDITAHFLTIADRLTVEENR